MSLEFFVTSLIVILLPGTGVLYTLAIGLGRGFRASVAAAIGCTLGILPAALAGIVGLSALLHSSAVAFMAIKYLGVAYLFYMAWGILRDGGVLQVSEDKSKKSYTRLAVTGALINVLNPKLSLFFLAFLPQFLSENPATVTRELLLLATVFMALTFVVFVGYGGFAAAARDYVIGRPRILRRLRIGFASSFGLLGGKLAFSD